MNLKLNKTSISSLLLVFSGNSLFAKDRGVDERINEAFTPIANWWEALVLHNFFGTEIPTIIFLLVGGALFFTVYFGFVNVRRFTTAINTVRGKYDKVDDPDFVHPDPAIALKKTDTSNAGSCIEEWKKKGTKMEKIKSC